jgi:hypothetical protein
MQTTAAGDCYWADEDNHYHRECDRPAIVTADGTQYWMRHGAYYRAKSLPVVVYKGPVNVYKRPDDSLCVVVPSTPEVTLGQTVQTVEIGKPMSPKTRPTLLEALLWLIPAVFSSAMLVLWAVRLIVN